MTNTTTDYSARLEVRGPAEALLGALTTADGCSAWWVPATGSAEEGGELRFHHGPPQPLVLHVAVAGPSLVRWNVLACDFLPDWVGTSINFAITATDAGCRLDFVHHGLDPQLECYDTCHVGWTHYLASLREYVETGTGHPNRHD